jgi:hypothetical protein
LDPIEWIDRLFGHAPWVPFLLWVIFIVGAVWFVGRMLIHMWKPLTRFVTTINSLAGLSQFMERTEAAIAKQGTQLDGIFHETHRNDGSSIKDSTVRLEKAVEDLRVSTDGLHGRMDRVETGVAGLYGKVDELEAADGEADERMDRIERTIPRDELGRFVSKDRS